MLLAGCMSGKDIVAVRQVKRPDKAVILRLCDDKTAIHSLLYPLSYEMKKTRIWTFVILTIHSCFMT